MAEEKKLVVNNEDGDSAEINLASKQPEPAPEIDWAAQVEDLNKQIKDKDDKILRLMADFANLKKHTAREKAEVSSVVEQAFLKDLLPLLDNLSRATEAAANAEDFDVETLRKGIEMIRQETAAVMGKHGLEPIDALGKPFDPNYHQAVGTLKDDSKPDGTVAAELQRGYIAHGRVIRPSMVQVVNND